MLLEFRVPLPYCVEDPNVGYLFMVMIANLEVTGGGEGVDWKINEPYDNTDGHLKIDYNGYEIPKNKGQYTLKHYLVQSKFPSLFARILPRESMVLVEETWCAPDYRFAVITNQYLDRKRFHVILQSKIVNNDDGTSSNIFGLFDTNVKKRIVQFYDICDTYKNEVIPPSLDMKLLKLDSIPGSPLSSGWYKTWDKKNISCHYWLLDINVDYFGIQTIGESIFLSQQSYMNRVCERQMISTIDQWKHLTMADIRKLEDENQKELTDKIKSKEIAMAYTTGM